MTTRIPQQSKRTFLPKTFRVEKWEDTLPYFKDLLDRTISDFSEFVQWMKDLSELNDVIGEDAKWRYVKTSIDTTDKQAQHMLETFYKEFSPNISVYQHEIHQKILNSPYLEDLKKEDPRFDNFIRSIEVDLRTYREENIPIVQKLKLKQNEYSIITGNWSIEHNGETLTIQQASKYLKDLHRPLREDIYRKMLARRLQDADSLDQLFTELVQMRHQTALNAGYQNYRDYKFDKLYRFDYSPEDCCQFHEVVADVIVPITRAIAKNRKESLQVEQLHPWDLSVDIHGEKPAKPFKSTEEFVEKTVACFNKLDPYFGKCIASMHSLGYLDIESKTGKAPGGYNMSMPESGSPFIFMNHTFSEMDIRVMVHEGGHAIHTFLSNLLEYSFFKEFPSEVAELASMSMELFSLEHWDVFYAKKEPLQRAKRNHLIGLLDTLVGVAKGDAFQHWVYLNPSHTVEERQAKWLELSEKFGNGVTDYSTLKQDCETHYHQILHFFLVPFYYIEYAFAQLGALAMWRNFKQDAQQTITQYKEALKLGYTKNIHEIYQTAGIRFDFSREYVTELSNFLQKEINALQKEEKKAIPMTV